ncbi:MAG: hypothetical protein H0U70_01850 [Tatlockia sp.]|nr:hypothetical protein [Tatlockia sp.]
MKSTIEILAENEKQKRHQKGESLSQFIDAHKGEKNFFNIGKRQHFNSTVNISVEQAQEQHIHQVVSQEINQEIAQSEYQNSNLIGMDFEALKTAIIKGRLNLRDGAAILTEHTLRSHWHRWMGDVLSRYGETSAFHLENPELESAHPIKICFTRNLHKIHKPGIIYLKKINDNWDFFLDSGDLHPIKKTMTERELYDLSTEIENTNNLLGQKNLVHQMDILRSDVEIEDELELIQFLLEALAIDNPQGLPFCAANKQLSTISEEAATQLLNNPQFFQQGLNPLQFDNGFILVKPHALASPILHYLPKAQKKKILFSPKPFEILKAQALGIDLCDLLIKKLPTILQKIWANIDLSNSELFRQNLLKLSQFSEPQLNNLFKVCQLDNNYDFLLLDYILTVYSKVADNFKSQPYDNFLTSAFNQELAQKNFTATPYQLIDLCKALASTPNNPRDLELIHLIDEAKNQPLKTQLALLEVYSIYGQNGLDAYSILAKTGAFSLVNTSLFSSLESYIPLIENIDKIKIALDVIDSFDEQKKAWFVRLLEKHAAIVGFDDLPTLVESFTSFANRIRAYNLEFYPLSERAFLSVKNLPTTLGAILSIFRENKTCDRDIQWAAITEINLDGNAAIRAMNDVNPPEFITPKMRIEPRYYNYSDSHTIGYKGSRDPKAIAKSKSFLEIQSNFYRYIAHQAHRLPLSFYQEMEQEINERFPLKSDDRNDLFKVVAMLYSLLASTTTGEENSLVHGDEPSTRADTKELWKSFIKALSDFRLPYLLRIFMTVEDGWRSLLNASYNLDGSPNLLIINQVLQFNIEIVESVAALIAEASFDKIGNLMKVRDEFAEKYGAAIYKSMKFYDDLVKNNKNLYDFSFNFYQKAIWLVVGSKIKGNTQRFYIKNYDIHSGFLNESKTQGEKIGSGISYPKGGYSEEKKYPPTLLKEAFAALLSLMSHFQIDKASLESIDELRASFFEECSQDYQRLVQGLTLLQSMKTVDKQWSILALKAFIESISANPHQKVSALVENAFGRQYFSSDFFELCNAEKLSDTVIKKINQYFNVEQRPQLINMLKIFGQATVVKLEQQLLVINALNSLYQSFPIKEGDTLFEYLTKPKIFGSDLAVFQELLTFLPLESNLHYFSYFVEKSAQSKDKSLTLKIHTFIKMAQYFVKPLQPYFSEKIILNLLSEKLLVANEADFDRLELEEFFGDLVALTKTYPQIKVKIVEYLPEFIKEYQDLDNSMWKILSESLRALDDSDQVLALFTNLLDAEEPLNLGFIREADYQNLSDKPLFWKIITQLSNNNLPLKQAAVNNLLKNFETNYQKLARIYSNAPYPTLEKAEKLVKATDFEEKLKQFNQRPYAKDKDNGFDLTKANAFRQLIKGFEFSLKDLEEFDEAIQKAERLNVVEIQHRLSLNQPPNLPYLVALNIRLLYLSTAKECNTIQHLAILGELKAGRRVIGQLETGEGKSRVNMLVAACQHQRKTTVDFITKDMHLAERDYLAYKAFFDAQGIKSQLLYGDSPIDAYQKGGIHFSTIHDLAHFRGVAHAKGHLDLVLEFNPQQRTLIIDESDFIFFGLFNNHFNLSKADPAMKNLAFVYEELIEFFYTNPQAKNWDALYCDEQFIRFVKAKDSGKAQLLEKVSFEQRKIWQESALIAMEMKLNDKFTIQSNLQKETEGGVKIVSEARVLMNNRPEKGEFTEGVHQFLHARLNWLKQADKNAQLNVKDREIVEYSASHPRMQAFLEEPEKRIYYSLTAKGVIDDYHEGFIYGATATPGTLKLQKEGQLLHKIEKTIVFPPANPSNRLSHPTYLTENNQTQMEWIAKEIRQAQQANRPFILFCEDDSESEKITAYLKGLAIPQITRLSAETDKKFESRYIAKLAGVPAAVTITTSVHGRGTDFGLDSSAKLKGFTARFSFLPKTLEEQQQLFGRVARFGDFGEAGYILSKAREKSRLGKSTLRDGFYFSAELYLENELALREQKTQVQRIIQFKVTDFLHALQSEFYRDFATISDEDLRTSAQGQWTTFYYQATRLGKELTPKLSGQVTVEAVNNNFKGYQLAIEKNWQETFNVPLPARLTLTLEDEFKPFFEPIVAKKMQVPVVDGYHPAHDGRAVLYNRPFEKWRALFRLERPLFADFRAWLDGRGILFPQLRAWWSGAMSFEQFLIGCELSESTLSKILITLVLVIATLLGAGLGTVLVMTGVFAPFGVGLYGLLILMGLGAAAGLLTAGVPMVLKAIFDWCTKSEPEIEVPVRVEDVQESYATMGILEGSNKTKELPQETNNFGSVFVTENRSQKSISFRKENPDQNKTKHGL